MDKVRPGWEKEIACDRLAMESCDDCVLGQLYGDYQRGWPIVLKTLPSCKIFAASKHGFTLRDTEQDQTREEITKILGRFKELADDWRDVIRERVNA